MKTEPHVPASEPVNPKYPLYTEKDLTIYRHTPFDLRCRGWMVAVHNDYTLNGERFTFWLLTNGNLCFRGEGKNDMIALDSIRSQIMAHEAEAFERDL